MEEVGGVAGDGEGAGVLEEALLDEGLHRHALLEANVAQRHVGDLPNLLVLVVLGKVS